MPQAKITVNDTQEKALGLLTYHTKSKYPILYDPKSRLNIRKTDVGEQLEVPDNADMTNLINLSNLGCLSILQVETDIIAFSFNEQTGPATIDTENHTIAIEVENGTDVTSLVAIFTLSDNAVAKIGETSQESGITANDFTEDVIYIITAEDTVTTQVWTVTVTVAS